MHHCVFVAPFLLEDTLRFVRAVARLPDVRLALVTQEPLEKTPQDVRAALTGFARVPDALDADALVAGARESVRSVGGRIDSLVGVLEQLQVPLADARARLSIAGTSPHAARNMRDKSRMKTVLREAGLPCARHALARSPAEALAGAEHTGFPLVAKPPDGAGAAGTVRIDDREQLASWLASSPPSDARPLLLEEFVVGDEFSFDSVSLDGKHLFHSISSYRPTPLEVVQTPWIQWCVLLPREIRGPEFSDILSVGPAALDALGMHTGMTHMEWFRRKDGTLAISEVAARPPGAQFMTLTSYAHDRDMYGSWARLVVGGGFQPPERRWACGAAYLRAQGSGTRVVAVHGLERARAELGSLVVEARLPRTGQTPSGTYTGEGHVVLRHAETAVVQRGLERLVATVRVELG